MGLGCGSLGFRGFGERKKSSFEWVVSRTLGHVGIPRLRMQMLEDVGAWARPCFLFSFVGDVGLAFRV